MLVNYHVHTEFSDDSIYDMEQVVIDAIEKGIDEICFCDHVDYGVKLDYGQKGTTYRLQDGEPIRNVNYPEYFKKLAYVKEKYKDQITIRKGLEYGVQMHTIDTYNKLFNDYPLDFSILSVHQVNDIEIFMEEYQKGDQIEYNRKYYKEILDVATDFDHYCVLGHLDHINRYDHKGECPIKESMDIIEKILKVVIAKGKGIEINTANRRYHLKDSQPCKEILELYLKLGGKIITIGSDSHKPADLNDGLKEAMELLKEIGFEYFCTFENMQPIFHKL